MTSKKNGKKKKKTTVSRKGVAVVLILAAAVLIVSIITATVSWFQPQSTDPKKGLQFSINSSLRSTDCTVSTSEGEKQTTANISQNIFKNQIRYLTPLTASKVFDSGTYYFKTNIVNSNPDNGTNVSLYIKNLPAGTTVSVTYPGNTVRHTGDAAVTDYALIRNAYVKEYVATDVNGPGLLEVEWSITLTVDNFSFGPDDLYLMFN